MYGNPYGSPVRMPAPSIRSAAWWLLALLAGAAIGFAFAVSHIPRAIHAPPRSSTSSGALPKANRGRSDAREQWPPPHVLQLPRTN